MLNDTPNYLQFDPDGIPALVIDRFLAFVTSGAYDSRDAILALSQINRSWRANLTGDRRNDKFYLPLLKIEAPFANELMQLEHVWHKHHGTSYREMYLLATSRRQARMVLLDTQPGKGPATLRVMRDPALPLPWFPIPHVARHMTEAGGFVYLTRLFRGCVHLYGGQAPLDTDDPRQDGNGTHNRFVRVKPGTRAFQFDCPVGEPKPFVDFAAGMQTVGVCPVYQTKDGEGNWTRTGYIRFDVSDVLGDGFTYFEDWPKTAYITSSFYSHCADQVREGMEDRDVGLVGLGRGAMCYITKDGKWLVEEDKVEHSSTSEREGSGRTESAGESKDTDDGGKAPVQGVGDETGKSKARLIDRTPKHLVVKSAFGECTSAVAIIPLSPKHALLS